MPIVINGSGSITGLSAGGLPDGSVQLADLATTGTASSSTFLRGDGAFAEAGGGKILQVVSTTVTSAAQVAMSTDGEDTLLSRTYTPTVSSSNALIQFSMHLDIDGSYGGMYLNVLRDSTLIAQGDAAGSRSRCTVVADFGNTGYGGGLHSFSILDTGISGTSQVTYKVNILDKHSSGGTYFFNMGRDTTNASYILRPVSTLTVYEVGA